MPLREHVEAHSFRLAAGAVDGLAVLDMGCGSGLFTRMLRSAGAARAVGLDSSEPMIDYARRREERDGLGVRFLLGDATADSPAELENRFDLVTAVYMLPYARTMDELTAMCATARRALRAGGPGRFLTYTMNPGLSVAPGRYRPYGLEPALAEPRHDGAAGVLRAWFGEHTLGLDFVYWSREAQEEALRRAGFTGISWIRPTVSAEGVKLFGAEFWDDYLDCPHSLLLEAVAG
ncbi:class I SAM-dependent methyltransferase [Streptomyces sp. NPDC014894]|uniref:class I SAM-dependent methyltransferase n=1 Tax=Streptomyces sp. NPDC014894 TaxID=3364931 RepID=UPI003700E686